MPSSEAMMQVDLRIMSKTNTAGITVVAEDRHAQAEACAPTLEQAMHDAIDMYFESRKNKGERRSSFRLNDGQLVVAIGEQKPGVKQ